jgi:hypothetical protein
MGWIPFGISDEDGMGFPFWILDGYWYGTLPLIWSYDALCKKAFLENFCTENVLFIYLLLFKHV